MAVKAVHNCPVKGWNEAVDDEGEKVCQSDGHVLVLVHLVSEQGSAGDEPNHSEHVERTEGGIAPEGVVDPTEERGRDGGDDPEEVPHQAELVGVLAVGGEGMEDCGHDHADLVAADDDEDDGEVLPGEPTWYRGRDEVPEKDGEEEDEAQEMGPDVESLIVETDN